MKSALLIPRERWGAAPPKHPVTMVKGKDLLIVHHSGADGYWPTEKEEMAGMRFWQAYHQGPVMKGADIYYGAVIFPSGRAYEGRQGGWLANNGGAYGCCGRGFGVCLAGNYSHKMPTKEALNTLITLAKEAVGVLSLDVNRIWGHRDCAVYDARNRGNECPGDTLYAWLPRLRRLVVRERQKERGEEEMPRFSLVRVIEEDGAAQKYYVYACGRINHSHRLDIHLEGPGHAHKLFFYAMPLKGEKMVTMKTAGGWDNSDNVFGASYYVYQLFGKCGDVRMAIHSPYPLAIEVSG